MFVKANLVLLPLIKHYDADVKAGGKTLEIPNVSAISAHLKQQNTVVTLNYNTETKTTINLDKHYESSFVVEDLVKVQSVYDLRSDYTQAASYAIAETIDGDLATSMASTFSAFGAYGTPINDTVILAVNRYLSDAKAPRSDRSLVVAPKGEAELLAIDKYVRYDALGVGGDANSIKNGKIGRIYGVDVFMSQNIAAEDTTNTNFQNLFFHKEAWAVALQQEPRTQAQYKQEYLGWLVTVDVIYGHTALRSDFGFVVRN